MKTIYNWILTTVIALITTTAFSQGTITGSVVDGSFGGPLPGANVMVKGSTSGTSTDFDGNFTLNVTENSGTIVVSYIGFVAKQVNYTLSNGSTNIGAVKLQPDSEELEGVVVVGSGIIDLARDRQTPIAVSTIPAKEIQQKIGTQDVSMMLVNTPSVYVSSQSSGFGDSQIRVRGFEQDNTAYLLNGQPINGMEDGKMYWSNWSGMADIANGIQIQRGLGSSKLAISSVGGTVNFVTKATDMNEGGFASIGVANDNYFKTTAAYNTGISEGGFGASVLLSHWQGDGYNDGTYGSGQSYFISFGYRPNEKHNLNFLITGAPQQHDQSYSKSIETYLERGRKFNNNNGTYRGEYMTEVGNYYHKPVMNLNWDWEVSDRSQLSTVLYGSWGRGGSIGSVGSRVRNSEGYVDFDAIYQNNINSPDGSATYALRNSVNNHSWYGLVTNFSHSINDNLDWNVGFDLRTYKGNHFRQIKDLLGADYYEDTRNVRYPDGNQISNTYTNNPWSAVFNYADEEDRYAWDYDERINYGGLFTQLEYSVNNFSAFFQGAISNQTHVRWDRYQYTVENEESEKVENFGYNVKGGGSYKFNDNNAFYVNAGYYSRQPYHDNIYLNFTNEVNPLTENEKILGLEAGYSFKSNFFSANLNLYRTSWKDRVTTSSRVTSDSEVIGGNTVPAETLLYTTNEGVEQLHQGIELDFTAFPVNRLRLKGFLSVGDWEYVGNSRTTIRDEDRNVLDFNDEDVDGGKVGGAAQFTVGLGFNYEIIRNLSIDSDYRYYDNLYSDVGAVKENLELPGYGLLDSGVSYKMILSDSKNKNSIDFRFNVNNVLHKIYLSELRTNNFAQPGDETYQGLAVSNEGYFGFGRTWNFSMRFNF
ncbi:TonB-dependent receptor [Joostella sp.]|uniref:TonB-dependent receptor n=1 Tax=Joostella sp. TaxID=2231138 RepID=UPI003A91C8EA